VVGQIPTRGIASPNDAGSRTPTPGVSLSEKNESPAYNWSGAGGVHDWCSHRVSSATQGHFIANNAARVFGRTMARGEQRAMYNRATASGPLTGYRRSLVSFHHLYAPHGLPGPWRALLVGGDLLCSCKDSLRGPACMRLLHRRATYTQQSELPSRFNGDAPCLP
jgi:hypothetical protein